MKIVLAEMRAGQKLGERQFEQSVVKVGRDPDKCHIVFEHTAWPTVSRHHGEFHLAEGRCLLVDTDSSFGTFLDGQPIKKQTEVRADALVQFGVDGPVLHVLRLENEVNIAHAPSAPPSSALAAPAGVANLQPTMVAAVDIRPSRPQTPVCPDTSAQPIMRVAFNGRRQISVGRAADNDIRLDGLQISSHHARFVESDNGIFVEDNDSTNGVFVNGGRVAGRSVVQKGDVVHINHFVLQIDGERGVAVFDMRSKTRIDAVNITKVVPDRAGRGSVKLLDGVDLTIQPNEFIGLLGPSGAGKSTLMDALNGMRPATDGRVFVNELDLYRHIDSLKQSIGYVPQDDRLHHELTVYRTLLYVARLRLSRDVSKEETNQIINEVLDVTGLTERRDVPVAELSGGQRKRVSIAVELITKPSVIFLDEPTSGLDPATEEKIMKLFRRIAESGRTVILTTHAMENVRLFDKIAVLMRGKLVFYGAPQEALAHLGAASFKNLYDKLEAPIEAELSRLESAPRSGAAGQTRDAEGTRARIGEAVAEQWRSRFQSTEVYWRNIARPLGEINPAQRSTNITRRRSTLTDAARQWATLTRRYTEVFARDRVNLFILFGQAPIIAFLTYLVIGAKQPRDFPYFMLSLSAIWFGASVAAREIIKERPVYKRERMVNLRLPPYILSKIFVLSLVVTSQCILLFGTLKILHYADLIYLPGLYNGLPQLLVMILTGVTGIALGLFVSALVKTSEMATSLVPLILIPQILFSGLVNAPKGIAKVVGAAMPVTWSFDGIKRSSALNALNEEGSVAKYVEEKNEEGKQKAQEAIDGYRLKTAGSIKDYERRMQQYLIDVQTNPDLARPEAPSPEAAPRLADAPEVGDDLKDFVSFTHPWGGAILNPAVLLLMFLGFVGATAAALRAQDAG